MPIFDLPLEQLRTYAPDIAEPADFDAFWRETIEETARRPLEARFERVDEPIYRAVGVHDAAFNGFGGQPIRGWMIEPAGDPSPLPCIVTFVGYGGGRGLPIDHLAPAVAGFAHFVMDTRGQGSVWSPGDTPDDAGGGPHHPGFITKGIDSPHNYYYRRVFVDAFRAVQAAGEHPRVDPARIAVSGASQGGGIAIAAAALWSMALSVNWSVTHPEALRAPGPAVKDGSTLLPKLLMADVPFLCHFRRAVELTDSVGYSEIRKYLSIHRNQVERAFATLAYFDGANFATRIAARTLFSAGLMDMVCPPSTIFAAYNRVSAEREIRLYGFNEHEGGGSHQAVERLRFASQHL